MQTMLYVVISICRSLPPQDLAYVAHNPKTKQTDKTHKNMMHETNEREKQHTQTDTNKIHTNKVERQQERNRKLEKRIINYTLIGVKDKTEDIDICEIINQNNNDGISPYILTNRHLFKYGSNQKHASQDIIKKFNVNYVPVDREVFYRDENPLTNTTNSKDMSKNAEKGKKHKKQRNHCKETDLNCKTRHNRRRKNGKKNKKQKQGENNKFGKHQTDYNATQRAINADITLENIIRTLGETPYLVELNEADSKRLQNVYDMHEFMTKLSNDEEHELGKLKNFTIEQVACPNSIEDKQILLAGIKIYELTIKTDNETEEKKKRTIKSINKLKQNLVNALEKYDKKQQNKKTKADQTKAINTKKNHGHNKKIATEQESARIRHNKKIKNRNRKQQTDIDTSITTLGPNPDTWKTQKRTNQTIDQHNKIMTNNDQNIAPVNNSTLQKSILNFFMGASRLLGRSQLPTNYESIQ
ncbi:hypothetical protein BDAP_002725 [Binucleata daphniae]